MYQGNVGFQCVFFAICFAKMFSTFCHSKIVIAIATYQLHNFSNLKTIPFPNVDIFQIKHGKYDGYVFNKSTVVDSVVTLQAA